jgi:hypothetical protein
MSKAQTLLKNTPDLLTHELYVDASVHSLIPQLLSRCVSVMTPNYKPSPERRGETDTGRRGETDTGRRGETDTERRGETDTALGRSADKLSEELRRILARPPPVRGAYSPVRWHSPVRGHSPVREGSLIRDLPFRVGGLETPPMHWPTGPDQGI